jgi:1-acyl-sn-glycerol-3-phosphate acyltransferase
VILAYLRSFMMAPVFVILTLILSLVGISLSFGANSFRRQRKVIKAWGRWTCFLFGVKVQARGLENWPYQSGGVVLFNHTSFFDIFAMVGFLPDMRFGAKKELFSIPFFGWAMKRAGILPIDRARRDQVYQIYEQSSHRLKFGEKIALAPEGERTRTPWTLQNFKAGPFLFALSAEVDLIPVIVCGAFQVMSKDQLIPNRKNMFSKITLDVLPPFSTKGYRVDSRKDLQDDLRAIMQTKLDQVSKEEAPNHGKVHAISNVPS